MEPDRDGVYQARRHPARDRDRRGPEREVGADPIDEHPAAAHLRDQHIDLGQRGMGARQDHHERRVQFKPSETQSRQVSAKHAQEITKKASSRSKEEHKITFRVATTQEVLEESYREIKNSLDRPIRLDYHRLMKKWQIGLYRYDVRLTYDIVIPEPGSYLLRKYVLLRVIENELAKPDPFSLGPIDITDEIDPKTGHYVWEDLAKEYGVSLDQPPPALMPPITVPHDIVYSKNSSRIVSGFFEFTLPSSYCIESCEPIGLSGPPDMYPTPPSGLPMWYLRHV